LANLSNVIEGTTGEWQKTNLGTSILFALFGITTVLVLLFIIGPLVLVVAGRLRPDGHKARLPSLFRMSGRGFHHRRGGDDSKVHSVSGPSGLFAGVVLFSVLAFSAIGSYLSGRVSHERLTPALMKLLVILVALVIVYIVVLPPIFYGLVGLAREIRIVLAVVLMAPLAW